MAKVLEGPGMGLLKKWGMSVPNYVVVTSTEQFEHSEEEQERVPHRRDGEIVPVLSEWNPVEVFVEQHADPMPQRYARKERRPVRYPEQESEKRDGEQHQTKMREPGRIGAVQQSIQRAVRGSVHRRSFR